MQNKERRLRICDYVKNYIKKNGRDPTVREIGVAVGVSSTSTVAGYLSRLVRDGMLQQGDTRYRKYHAA